MREFLNKSRSRNYVDGCVEEAKVGDLVKVHHGKALIERQILVVTKSSNGKVYILDGIDKTFKEEELIDIRRMQ